MPPRRITIGYLIFYVLFSADTWRVLCGLVLALLLTPVLGPNLPKSAAAQTVLMVMLVAIGYAVSAYPGRKIAQLLKKFFLGPVGK